MDMQEIVNLALNSGTAIVVIGFFMYRDVRFMGTLQTTLTTLVDTVETLKDFVYELKLSGFHTEIKKEE